MAKQRKIGLGVKRGVRVVVKLDSAFMLSGDDREYRYGTYAGKSASAISVRLDDNGTEAAVEIPLDAVAYVMRLVSKREVAAALDLDPDSPIFLDIVGTREAADYLGVERPRIGKWQKDGQMPQPCARFRAGPVWWTHDVEALREGRERRRRPERTSSAL